MKLLKAEVHNILRVSDADLDTSGYHLYLVGGKNANGKSSALKAIACALCGRRDMGEDWPDILLKDGEDSGYVKLTLSGDDELHDTEGFTVELLLRRKRGGVVAEEFRVTDSTGEEAPEPRALLKRLYSMSAFDPLEFEKCTTKHRATILRDLVGLDFTELDAARAEMYRKRTEVNREVKNFKALKDSLEVPIGTPDEAVSASDLFEELNRINDHNDAVAKAEERYRDLVRVEEGAKKHEEELKAQLNALDQHRRQLDFDLAAAEKEKDVPRLDPSEVQEKIKSADETNKNVNTMKARVIAVEQFKESTASATVLSSRISAIDNEKQERLERASWPIPNINLDDRGVLLNGLPFEQASKAERVLASVRVGMALHPKLKLLLCQDGNDLDNDTMQALDEALEQEDFQLLLEYVTRDETDEARCAVVFREGKGSVPVEA